VVTALTELPIFPGSILMPLKYLVSIDIVDNEDKFGHISSSGPY
jgi:hypothetical protein